MLLDYVTWQNAILVFLGAVICLGFIVAIVDGVRQVSSTTKPKFKKLSRQACPKCRRSYFLKGTAMVPASWGKGGWRFAPQPTQVVDLICECGWTGQQADLITINYRREVFA